MAEYNGTIFDDTLYGETGGDILRGGKGDDNLYAYVGGVTIYGGDDDDGLFASAMTGVVRLYGDAGNDDMGGGDGRDLIYGGEGNDYVNLSGGNDLLSGDAGVDVLLLFGLDQGAGVSFTLGAGGRGSVSVPLRSGTTQYSGFEGLAGGGFADSLTGNGEANKLMGNPGDDTLNGRGGADELWGNEGHDLLIGGGGADLFVFDGGPNRRDFAPSADRVADYVVADDSLVFWARNFTGLRATGEAVTIGASTVFALEAAQFAIQTTKVATSLSTRIIYDQDDGLLYYDADGALSGYKSVLVADLGAGLALTAADFFVI